MADIAKDIDPFLHTIVAKFQPQLQLMDFFFLHKSKKDRRVFSFLRGMSGMRLSVTDEGGPIVQFESTWVRYDSEPMTLSPNSYRPVRRGSSLGMSTMVLPFRDVTSISLFEYGFEVRTEDDAEMVAITSSAYAQPLNYADAYEILNKRRWEMPAIRQDVNSETKVIWMRPNDDFDNFLRRKLKHHKMDENGPCIGQAKRRLKVDSDL